MFEKKLVAVMNKKIDKGVAMNALAHMCLGFGAHLGKENTHLVDYQDQDEFIYPNISKMPFIILKEKNSNRILKLVQEAKREGIEYSVFTDTMTGGSWEEQLEKTKVKTSEELVYYGVVLLGPYDKVQALTRKLSLWRDS